ncbi:hypothetical protein LRP52_00560 [Photobacterium sp. ZSDE20]|uniref:Uncharacterized protein n=1 Tax=Photobacterium pectinilyticum TaxID=2906793 RepID=A0ABT1MVM5_9GAMM|nr:hypothetical protein [Photobacterium sp. ZSDE20]MCQ1056556.1 hypothetical protein [Photobacterium sp. ZSDE20]MDD1820691.1 hypothetical protein [Photobacterium sp. ZSDE20]
MDTEQYVKDILENHFELTVEKIPETQTKTPDFFVTGEEEQYLIEVKRKEANPALEEAREEAFANDEMFEISQTIDTTNILQKVISNANKQIRAHAEGDELLRVIWVHCTGVAHEAIADQLITGLYGSETIVSFGDSKQLSGNCYYFGHSQFYRYHDIDAVMVTNQNDSAILCLNNYSPRYERMKGSKLASKMTKGVRDPIVEAESGKALIVDGEVDRRNPEEVLRFLKDKYEEEKLMVMPMTHFEVHTAIPHQ